MIATSTQQTLGDALVLSGNDRAIDRLRAFAHIETLGLAIDYHPTPDDTWYRVREQHFGRTTEGEWVFGDLAAAVKSCVEKAGRDWKQFDHQFE